MLLSKATYIAFKLQFYIWPALAFPGNQTHDLGIASAMLYQLSYRKAVIYTVHMHILCKQKLLFISAVKRLIAFKIKVFILFSK